MELKASLYNGLGAIWHSDSNLLSIKRYVHLPENRKRVFHRGQSCDPCCFLYIYMTDIHTVSDKLDFILHADDTTLTSPICSVTHGAHNDVSHISSLINSELLKISDWLTVNKLSLHVEKINFMFFYNFQRVIANEDILHLMINDKKIERVSCFNSLGLTINEFMNWSSHSAKIANIMSGTLGKWIS